MAGVYIPRLLPPQKWKSYRKKTESGKIPTGFLLILPRKMSILPRGKKTGRILDSVTGSPPPVFAPNFLRVFRLGGSGPNRPRHSLQRPELRRVGGVPGGQAAPARNVQEKGPKSGPPTPQKPDFPKSKIFRFYETKSGILPQSHGFWGTFSDLGNGHRNLLHPMGFL